MKGKTRAITSRAEALDPSDLISGEEVTELTDLQPGTLAKMRRLGRGPVYYKLSYRTIRYSRAGVLAWIAARRVSPTGAPKRKPAAGGEQLTA